MLAYELTLDVVADLEKKRGSCRHRTSADTDIEFVREACSYLTTVFFLKAPVGRDEG